MQKIKGYYSLELGGKERTLHFSMNFWAALTEELGVSLQELDKVFGNEMALSSVRAIVYCGLLAYDQEESNEIDYNEFKVGMWLEDFDSDELNNVVNAMMESRILGNDLNAGLNRNVKNTTKKGK